MKVSSSKPSSFHQSADKFRATRPLDYIYDPLFTFSGPKDYYKSANESIQSASEYTVRPIFDSMFSDMVRYPRANLELRPAHQLPRSIDTSYNGKVKAIAQERKVTTEVTGSDRFKYFRRPVTELPKISPRGSRFPLVGNTLGVTAPPATALRVKSRSVARSPGPRHACAQTDYRESETQTTPWQPEYTTKGEAMPEVLYLDRLSWGDGLPPGRHEVDIVERLRMKRTWESLLPAPDSPSSIRLRYRIIADIEKSDWLFRDQEIQSIHDERMKKSEKQMEEHKLWHRSRLVYRMDFLEEEYNKVKERKLELIRRDHERALRKLCMKEKGYKPKQKIPNITEEHLVRSSELYAPTKKMGTSFKNRHEKLSEKHITICAEDLSPEVIMLERRPVFDFNKASQPKKQTELCPRETRWTMDNLAQLHHDLQTLRAKEQRSMDTFFTHSLQRLNGPTRDVHVPKVSLTDEGREKLYQAATLIQRVIRGRAEQAQMYQARERWRDVLSELKSNESLTKDQLAALYKSKEEANNEIRLSGVVQCIVGNNVGSTIAQTLDLLASELLRFRNEGIAHAQALQAEYARVKREAPEGGRRQKEMRRREEHNLMFAQLLDEYQRSIDDTLSELVVRAREHEAKVGAYEHGKEVARLKALAALQEEEVEEVPVSADLLFEFIAPDGLRELTRTCMLILKDKYARARRRMLGHEESSAQQTTTADQPSTSYAYYGYSQDYDLNYTEEDDTTVTVTGPTTMGTEGSSTSDEAQEAPEEGRRFGLVSSSRPEDRLLARVMRDMCYTAGALLHTAAKILNRALQIANIPRESFEEALRRTMCVINEAREEIARLILPPTKSKTQGFILPSTIASEGTIQEALRIVTEIIAKAKEKIAERVQSPDKSTPGVESEVHSKTKKLVDEEIKEAQRTVLRAVVEDFLTDLLKEAEDTAEAIKGQSSP